MLTHTQKKTAKNLANVGGEQGETGGHFIEDPAGKVKKKARDGRSLIIVRMKGNGSAAVLLG